ncbi:acyl carrier protein [Alkalispirillum mobile]|uniref:Acyl carrier protein n=1 Tax=Alkalispirillum mobile TaxID=85925 RepID=A0A498BY83_9GAMM|nr:acyl carrier protein [Alkalispirillum mobile]RLK48794.1 acyl carrier protein [Alkalispirillum mobile]
MNETEARIQEAMNRLLAEISPETDLTGLQDDHSFHQDLDMDSVDFLRLMLGLEQALGVKIPDGDYTQLSTPGGCRRYLRRLLEQHAEPVQGRTDAQVR